MGKPEEKNQTKPSRPAQGTEKSKNEIGKARRGRTGSTERGGGLTFPWKPLKESVL